MKNLISNTYQNIQEKQDIIWKNQRLDVILEYRSIFSPPLNFITYIFDAINNNDSKYERNAKFESKHCYFFTIYGNLKKLNIFK